MIQFGLRALTQFKNAFFYSCDGLHAAITEEFAFQLELIVMVIALPLVFILGKTPLERILLISSLFLVLMIELINSALETILNRIDRSWNPLTKKAKDMGSAAVFLGMINAAIVWIIIFFSHHSV